MLLTSRCRYLCALCLLPFSVLTKADPFPPPEGDVLLRLTGDIAHVNVGDELHLDRAMLMSLSPVVVETTTPWTEGVGRFEGPLARAVLDAAGADAEHVQVRALDAFEAKVPVSDFHEYDVILAIQRDGEPIAVRDLGPAFLLYPFDDHPELLNETIRFRSVWHVGTIHVP
ncbi:molybdopterin-dependent oxidoreductase [Halomonas sp. ANAO-440]|uniref:molybdopterin-dependent oxidoreductase n=1 Tax=Halomonas sp. ANAO-440 TaxID=2861360 RepID=UPI001CAA7C46|nr:molybdopterin-dependent oxidoreductase [Halomonas sp. ANAO-440]MBZ0329497.1 molybdopterin-dependent oxidoreductase [Halomonas sp. ANAO-440]